MRYSMPVVWGLCLLLSSCRHATRSDAALLYGLDRYIAERPAYPVMPEYQPDSLYTLLRDSMTDSERFEIYGWLLENFRVYNLDSQQYYAELRVRMAKTPFERQVSLLNYSEVMMRRGEYDKMALYIDSALLQPLNPALAPYYYQTLYPVMEQAYLEQVRRRQYWMIGAVVSVAVIAAMLVFILMYIHRKHRQLEVLNQRLTKSNEDLRRSNRIKSVYVRRFMKMTTIRDFDDAFLELFPDFVAQVRTLLVPEAELRIKPQERLNTDLRVLALIYLGIDDSRQIAEFLRYSLPTIYNSRTRMRNLAKEDRDHFEEKVADL